MKTWTKLTAGKPKGDKNVFYDQALEAAESRGNLLDAEWVRLLNSLYKNGRVKYEVFQLNIYDLSKSLIFCTRENSH